MFQRIPCRDAVSRSRVERFSQSEGRTPGPHHRGYSNCTAGWRTERAVFHPQLRRLAEANPLFTELSSDVVARTTPQYGSNEVLQDDPWFKHKHCMVMLHHS
ncbi:hypothetical protein ATANTOWER_021103 [Ataeniobius toweri]|uniref:Uncharacterized protein n=1 Tax=Ataeniobius toweri TaxID=208326 RepID=A0ABU7BXB1_9TELE|nr:hypothetical protein [Ataeniobius toweri]